MRILIWSPVCRSPESADWMWLNDGMLAAGHHLVAVDAYALGDIFGPERMQDILLAYAQTYRVQAALVLPQHAISPTFLGRLRALGVAVVRLHPDEGLGLASALPLCHPVMMALDAGIGAACDLTVTSSPQFPGADALDGAWIYLPLPERPPTATERPLQTGAKSDFGWARWWQAVVERLGRQGVTLDRAAPPTQLDPATTTLVAMATTALGHVHEQAGRTSQARAAYAEVLVYDPTDYSANAGLARLTNDPEAARRHWQTAARHIGTRLFVALPGLLGLPGVPAEGTLFAYKAAAEWARLAVESQSLDELVEAVSYLSPLREGAGEQAAQVLLQNGHADLARLCLALELANWPRNPQARELRSRLVAGPGQAGG